MKTGLIFLLVALFLSSCKDSGELAVPSKIQYEWHEQERIMFVCLDPCTWQGREYDNHSTPLERINPEKLDTDQWCEAAMSWGAREILFVAKHTGGFCWWQTETTDYGIKDTPYKDGKGDLLAELSASCSKYGLNLGIYVYPGDDTWGAGIGSGGQTEDPSKQEAYNEVFRKQLKEVLSNYGEVMEVWFDGSCVIDVSDILETYAQKSVIFQGPHASLRWPGTESGKLFYPAWNTVNKEDMQTGVSTQVHGDPDGDVWAPLETNTTLYDHHWFWAPWKEEKRKSLDQLMECYYRSVGYGSVFLLNSTPDTTGLIPGDDIDLFRAFGAEIKRRFENPVAEINDVEGNKVDLGISSETLINHVVIMEDFRLGHRIREYSIEGLVDGEWLELSGGTSVGRMKIDYFDDVIISGLRLHIAKYAAKPSIRKIAAYHVKDFIPPLDAPIRPYSQWKDLMTWDATGIIDSLMSLKIELSSHIKLPGQYTLKLSHGDNCMIDIQDADIYYEGRKALAEFVSISGNEIHINRTAQVTGESSSVLHIRFRSDEGCSGVIQFRPSLIY